MSLEKVLKQYRDVINRKVTRHWVSLGPVCVNLAVGDIRGVESGRIIQVVGRESSGKTTLAMDIVSQYQKMYPDALVLWVDYERSYSVELATAIGIDPNRIYIATPDTAEEGYDMVLDFIKGGVKLVIVDSAAASVPSSETTRGLQENAKMAGSASILTRFAQQATGICFNYDATVVIINQFRKNFSTLSPIEEVPFGGMALQYATSVLLSLAKTKTEAKFQRTQVIVRKNKVHNPQVRAEFVINYGEGIDHTAALLEMAKDYGIVTLSGSWYRYKDLSAQGITRAGEVFPLEEIKEAVIAAVSKQKEEAHVE